MNYIKRILAVALFMSLGMAKVHADEGMWLLMNLNKNYEEMRDLGLKLSPEDIYSVNNSSLKDAIVSLRFCTASFVSEQGLMFTNHHCAYSTIQNQSTVDADYLTDGFWAKSYEEELPAKGVTASILVRMEDVTSRIFGTLDDNMSPVERSAAIQNEIKSIAAEAEEDNEYRTEVKSMLEGNQYVLFVYETYRDVRLVGAPPSSIGKFGGDADNWEWPRHTGDFAMLRVYTAPDGSPADYSEENVPYQPRHHLPVSLKGVQKGDYAMVMGFPGRTQRYLSSFGIRMAQKSSNPARIKARTEVLDIIKSSMNKSDSVRISYAARYSQISNYWKYYIGQNEGLARLSTIEKKEMQEEAFQEWASQNTERKEKYGDILSDIDSIYNLLEQYDKYVQYLNEAAFASKPVALALRARGLKSVLEKDEYSEEELNGEVEKFRSRVESTFEDYHRLTEKRLLAAGVRLFYNNVPDEQIDEDIRELVDKYNGDWNKLAEKIFKKSFFDTRDEMNDFLEDPSLKKLEKDPIYKLANNYLEPYYGNIASKRRSARSTLDELQRIYLEGMMKMNEEKHFYPDANSTLRLTYGTVKGYHPKDAVYYDYYTTLEGMMDKEDPTDDEFIVSDKLKKLYEKKDYGRYGVDGEMRVNFITNNDITGGNSGSPVINGKGELIGLAFDGNWEAMTGDLVFDEEFKRCINADIRYVLFVIDKYADADHLIDEMNVVL